MAQPVAHSYGKDAVSVYRVEGDRLFACEVRLIARGEALESSYTEGDNSLVVATDSMKNFIQRQAAGYRGECLEDFLVEVGQRFLERYGHLQAVELSAQETVFARRARSVLQSLYDDCSVAEATLHADGTRHERSGRKGLHLIKLSGSSFAGFVRDEYTTLPEARDRPLFVHLDVSWHNADYSRRVAGEDVRGTVIEAFDEFESASIQHLVHEMGVRALTRFPEIDNIAFHAENRLWDAAVEADGVTVYTDARPPFGVITLSLDR
jgi:urate oxidase / 2-oxo-4-hydroxy-4-carboxy-5-ureidoimidazoline decarboxylase